MMSKRGVEYKLERLEKLGVISGYSPIINLSQFGYYYFRVFVRFRGLTSALREKIDAYAQRKPEIGWFFWGHGVYDAGFTIWAKSLVEFKVLVNDFYLHFDEHIDVRHESIGIEINFYKNRYLVGSKDISKISLREKQGEVAIDVLDLKLLKLLIKHPRASVVDLADLLKESPKKVGYRLKRLYRDNILLAIRPNIDHRLLGKTYYKLLMYLNNVDEELIKKLEAFIEKSPLTVYVVKAFGTCDLDVEMMVDSNEELFQFIESLHSHFPNSLKGYDTVIFTGMVKEQFLPVM